MDYRCVCSECLEARQDSLRRLQNTFSMPAGTSPKRKANSMALLEIKICRGMVGRGDAVVIGVNDSPEQGAKYVLDINGKQWPQQVEGFDVACATACELMRRMIGGTLQKGWID